MKTKKLASLALCVAVAMILSYVESQIPPLAAIPGIKIGLANIAVVFALYKLGTGEAAAVTLVRVALVGLLFGNGVSLWYSLAGAILSLAGMWGLKKTGWFSAAAVSVAGGVLHNVGQIAVACLLLGTGAIAYYLPALIFSGVGAGLAIGLVSGVLVSRVRI